VCVRVYPRKLHPYIQMAVELFTMYLGCHASIFFFFFSPSCGFWLSCFLALFLKTQLNLAFIQNCACLYLKPVEQTLSLSQTSRCELPVARLLAVHKSTQPQTAHPNLPVTIIHTSSPQGYGEPLLRGMWRGRWHKSTHTNPYVHAHVHKFIPTHIPNLSIHPNIHPSIQTVKYSFIQSNTYMAFICNQVSAQRMEERMSTSSHGDHSTISIVSGFTRLLSRTPPFITTCHVTSF